MSCFSSPSKIVICILSCLFSFNLLAQEESLTVVKIKSAMQSEIRNAEEIARDRARKPLETLEFFGFKEDMAVLELVPGGGWYTKILAQVLQENGELYLALGATGTKANMEKLDLKKIRLAEKKVSIQRRPYGQAIIDEVDFGVGDLDMVLTFRNQHNFEQESRMKLNKAVFNALKSGGIYGIVDHTKRHMEPYSREVWRRLDPVLVIKEVQDAGFIFEGYSDLHYRPDDELRYDTVRPSIDRYSDRFTLKFRKP